MTTVFVAVLIVAIYFVPSFVAYKTKHRQAVAILWANAFFGWFPLAWCGLIVWALIRPAQIIIVR